VKPHTILLPKWYLFEEPIKFVLRKKKGRLGFFWCRLFQDAALTATNLPFKASSDTILMGFNNMFFSVRTFAYTILTEMA
jgi:hypothetical protein